MTYLKGAAATTAAVAVGSAAIIAPTPSYAQQVDAAKKWVDAEFQPSTLTKDQQMAEMEWFIKASQPFKGHGGQHASRKSSAFTNTKSKTLTKAFAEITGIKVNHEMMNEGLLVYKIAVEIAVRQADLRFLDERLRLHRHTSALQRHRRRLADRFHGRRRQGHHQARRSTSRTSSASISPPIVDGKIYRLPDQQFANLYWFRYDWFQRSGDQGRVQGQVRLRPRRARQLVGL